MKKKRAKKGKIKNEGKSWRKQDTQELTGDVDYRIHILRDEGWTSLTMKRPSDAMRRDRTKTPGTLFQTICRHKSECGTRGKGRSTDGKECKHKKCC